MKKIKRPHAKIQKYIGVVLIPIIVAGFYYTWLGYAVLGCMIAGLGVAIFKGRKWCDFYCPRGSFLDQYISPISRQKDLPNWFYTYKFRLLFITGLFTFLITNIVLAWPDATAIGFAFVKTLTITTILSIIFGIALRGRTWCVVCPVGTFGGILGGKKYPLKLTKSKCVDCENCARVCPMGLKPHKEESWDCIKCKTCVENCPKKALKFKN
jgi:polyferredoxin